MGKKLIYIVLFVISTCRFVTCAENGTTSRSFTRFFSLFKRNHIEAAKWSTDLSLKASLKESMSNFHSSVRSSLGLSNYLSLSHDSMASWCLITDYARNLNSLADPADYKATIKSMDREYSSCPPTQLWLSHMLKKRRIYPVYKLFIEHGAESDSNVASYIPQEVIDKADGEMIAYLQRTSMPKQMSVKSTQMEESILAENPHLQELQEVNNRVKNTYLEKAIDHDCMPGVLGAIAAGADLNTTGSSGDKVLGVVAHNKGNFTPEQLAYAQWYLIDKGAK